MNLKMGFNVTIELFELSNFSVHQMLIQWWHNFGKFNRKHFPIHFQYIVNVSSNSPSVSDGVVYFELTVPIAKLLSLMRPFI